MARFAVSVSPKDQLDGAGAPRHGAQARDAFLGRRMAGKKPGYAAMQRIDDEHMRGGGIGVGGSIVDPLAELSIAASALASQSGRPVSSAPALSASNSRDRQIAACTSMAANGASSVTSSTPTRPSGLLRRRRP